MGLSYSYLLHNLLFHCVVFLHHLNAVRTIVMGSAPSIPPVDGRQRMRGLIEIERQLYGKSGCVRRGAELLGKTLSQQFRRGVVGDACRNACFDVRCNHESFFHRTAGSAHLHPVVRSSPLFISWPSMFWPTGTSRRGHCMLALNMKPSVQRTVVFGRGVGDPRHINTDTLSLCCIMFVQRPRAELAQLITERLAPARWLYRTSVKEVAVFRHSGIFQETRCVASATKTR